MTGGRKCTVATVEHYKEGEGEVVVNVVVAGRPLG